MVSIGHSTGYEGEEGAKCTCCGDCEASVGHDIDNGLVEDGEYVDGDDGSRHMETACVAYGDKIDIDHLSSESQDRHHTQSIIDMSKRVGSLPNI